MRFKVCLRKAGLTVKRAVLLLLGALVMSGGLGPSGTATAQELASTSTELTLSLADIGVFAVNFTQSSFSLQEVVPSTLFESGVAEGTVMLEITDTHAYRGEFTIQVMASDFISDTQIQYENATAYYSIGAENLTLLRTQNPVQTRCSCDSPGYLYPVGDVYAVSVSGTWGFGPYEWTFANSLDQKRLVDRGFAGSGTIVTLQELDLRLLLPPALPGGTYVSTMTATYSLDIP